MALMDQRVPETIPGDLQGQNYFHNHYLPFLSSFSQEFREFSRSYIQMMSSLTVNEMCVH